MECKTIINVKPTSMINIDIQMTATPVRMMYRILENKATPLYKAYVKRIKKGLYRFRIRTQFQYFDYFKNLLSHLSDYDHKN